MINITDLMFWMLAHGHAKTNKVTVQESTLTIVHEYPAPSSHGRVLHICYRKSGVSHLPTQYLPRYQELGITR